jgi:hypothetical protein
MIKAPATSRATFLVGNTEVDGITSDLVVEVVDEVDETLPVIVWLEVVLLELDAMENIAVNVAGVAILNWRVLDELSMPKLELAFQF